MMLCTRCHQRTLIIVAVNHTAAGIQVDFKCLSCSTGYITVNGKRLLVRKLREVNKKYRREKRAAFEKLLKAKGLTE